MNDHAADMPVRSITATRLRAFGGGDGGFWPGATAD